jgi:hypothetical protein
MSKADVSGSGTCDDADRKMLRRVLYSRIARSIGGMVVE